MRGVSGLGEGRSGAGLSPGGLPVSETVHTAPPGVDGPASPQVDSRRPRALLGSPGRQWCGGHHLPLVVTQPQLRLLVGAGHAGQEGVQVVGGGLAEVRQVGLGPDHPGPAGGGGRSGGHLALVSPQSTGGGARARPQVEADLTVGSLEGRQSDLGLGQVDHGGGGGGLDAVHAGVPGLVGQGVLADHLHHSLVQGGRALVSLLPGRDVRDTVARIPPGSGHCGAQLALSCC